MNEMNEMYELNEQTLAMLDELLTEEFAQDEHKVKCSCCGNMVDENDTWMLPNGEIICDDCRDEYYFICEHCGQLISQDDAVWFRDDAYCENCADSLFCECDDCGELMWRDDGYWTANERHICDDCRDNYTWCRDCDSLYHNDDIYWDNDTDEPYCYDCYQRRQCKAIHGYYYKPIPIFYGGSENINLDKPIVNYPLYLGVELEIDNGGEDCEKAQEIMETVNDINTHVYCKHDGSLEDGFEIVSHPCTLEYHCNNLNWDRLMQKALALNYRSHDTETCGLHVHVSRTALGDTWDERDKTISKILYFVEKNWWKIVKFTRRKDNNLAHWASAYGIENNSVFDTYEKAKGDYNRYRCINLQNDHTIEFRIFRGTLKHSTFIATLQFVNDLCEICKQLSIEAIANLEWFDFVSMLPENHIELIDYLRARNLY